MSSTPLRTGFPALVALLLVACTVGAPTTPAGTYETSPTAAASPPNGSGAPTAAPPAGGPPARGYHALVSVNGRGVALIGGFAPIPGVGEPFSDTWLHEVTSGWTEVATGPAYGVTDHGAFDTGSRRLITGLGKTWALDPETAVWELVRADGPGSDDGSRSAYDAQSDRVIFVSSAGATWAYDHDRTSWTRMNPEVSPPRRGWGAMAYDAESDRMLLFGGAGAAGHLGDTWAYDYDRDSWTEMAPTDSPAARTYSAMAYDPVGGRMILFGGAAGPQDHEEVSDDTWAYDYASNTWSELSTGTSPSARGWHAMAYDGEADHIVLFGGGADRDGYTSETWLFDPTTDRWTEGPATSPRASLTLTSEGCAYQGPMQFTAGELSVTAVNETTDGGNFEILRLGDDRSYEELAALFEDVQRAVDEGTLEPPQPPGLYTELRRLWVDPGEEGELAGPVRAGTHAFLCGQISGEPMELLRVTVRGPIKIME